ncbi:MAG: glycosyltransferase family 2 protein [Pirellulales bacterium]|nr:glycosyltransferase family 2 protein [Pirellulales bacterium]
MIQKDFRQLSGTGSGNRLTSPLSANNPREALPTAELTTGLSVVVPVYRSQETLPPLVAELAAVLPQLASKYELLLVNDGSPDDSWPVIELLCQKYPWVRGIRMMRNYGQHNAILCGVRAARCGTIVTMDDDLQHPPAEISKLLAKLAEGHDVVYGTPSNLPHSWWRNFTSRFTKRAFALATGNHTIKDINAFRAFRTHLRDAFADFRSPQLQIDVLLSWGTNKFATTPVRQEPRSVGRSNYSFMKLVNHTMLLLTGFSTAPLRLASFTGLAFTALGFFVLAYAVIRYFVGEAQPGFPFIAAIISIFSGIQLFILGIIGEYLARMFNRSLERPPYVASEQIGQLALGDSALGDHSSTEIVDPANWKGTLPVCKAA